MNSVGNAVHSLHISEEGSVTYFPESHIWSHHTKVDINSFTTKKQTTKFSSAIFKKVKCKLYHI